MTNINQNKQEVVHSLLEDNGEKERLKGDNSFTNSQLLIYSLSYNGIWSENQIVATPIYTDFKYSFSSRWLGQSGSFSCLLLQFICLLILNVDQFLPKQKSTTR